jgi:hypothetical protein
MASLGIGIACTTSVGPRFTLASEFQCLGQSLVRRLITPRGSMPWAPNDGTDIRDFLNQGHKPRNTFLVQQAVKDEVEKDERVQSALVSAAFAGDSMTLTLQVVTASGPFKLILLVDTLTISILGGG